MIDNEDVDDVLDALRRHYAHRLSEWENGFVASVSEQWEEKDGLTDKQRGKLEEIFDRVSGGGRDGGRSA